MRANSPVDVFKYIDMTPGPDECWPWKSDAKGGGRDRRPYFRLNGTRVLAYRLVYTLATGKELKDDDIIRHTCDNGSYPVRCCNPAHLVAGTHAENMRDMRERQRHGLPHHTVRRIRGLVSEGRTHKDIADMYGVSRQTVTDIANRITYKEVNDDE